MNKDRRKQIGEMLEKDGIVYLSRLCKLFPDVSTMTLRRDLDWFEANGTAVRIYGGAQKKDAGSEPFYNFRANRNREAKEKIGRLCLRHIQEGRSIFIDCGTTAMELAKALPNVKLNVITCGTNIGTEIARHSNADVMILGGQLNRENLSLSGKLTLDALDNINIDVAFVASSGFSLSGGFSCGSYSECEVKRKVLSKAQKKVMMLDGEKIGKSLMFTFANVHDIDILVTDAPPPDEVSALFGASGKTIICN